MNNIVLIGYMGSGKTTVGKNICKKNGYSFIDTDEYIENEQKMSVNEIFDRHGEEFFRNLETETIKSLSETVSRAVIATGGGLPVKPENEKYLKALGRVYYLKTEADVIYNRLKNDSTRPLLKSGDLYNRICSMLETREPRYMECSNYIIEIGSDASIEDVAEMILQLQAEDRS